MYANMQTPWRLTQMEQNAQSCTFWSRLSCLSGALPEKLKLLRGREGKNFLTQRRKGAKKTLETRQRFAPLRLCVRNLLHLGPFRATPLCGYGSGGAGLSVPRSRLNGEEGNHAGIASSLAARRPITNIRLATVRGPVQSQSGRTMSVGW